jgi:hypothetical protein
MKMKAVLVGLGLLVFILCSVSLSQAEMHPNYKMRFMAPPNEHPWQHDDSNGYEDGSDDDLLQMIIPVSPTIKVILIIRTPQFITDSGEKAADVCVSERNKQHFQGIK